MLAAPRHAIYGVSHNWLLLLSEEMEEKLLKLSYQANLETIALAVKRERLRRDLSQEELAHRAEISVRHLQKIEAGNLNFTIKTISRIVDALDLSLMELLTANK